jgi:hypothetical protein
MHEEFRHPPPSGKNLKIDRTDLLLVAFELHRFLDGFGIIKLSLRQKSWYCNVNEYENGGLNKDLTRHTQRHTSNMTDFAMEMQDAF